MIVGPGESHWEFSVYHKGWAQEVPLGGLLTLPRVDGKFSTKSARLSSLQNDISVYGGPGAHPSSVLQCRMAVKV